MKYRIELLTENNKNDLNRANQPFDIIGRMELAFFGGVWSYKEELFQTVTKKQYPNYNGAEVLDYINSGSRCAYLVYEDKNCVGQILLVKTWNNYAHIEDISVAAANRKEGIGTLLIEKAEEWAKEKGLSALSLECQDNNIPASRFLAKCGFEIGGVNTDLYKLLGEPYSKETAVFWYKGI